MKTRSLKVKKLYLAQAGIGVVLLLVALAIFFIFQRGYNSYRPKEASRQYFIGMELNYSEKAVFKETETGVLIEDGSNKNQVDPVPLIYPGDANKKLTITGNMLYMNPYYSDEAKKLNAFTSVENVDGFVRITRGKEAANVSGGFLFDGDSTYVILEPAVLTIGNAQIPLSANSYVVATYRNSIEYYNAEDGFYEWVYLNGMDTSLVFEDKYTIDIGRDVIIVDDKESLIFSAVDAVALMKLE